MNIANVSNEKNNDIESQSITELALLKLLFTLIARAGFVLIQSGSVPTEQFYDLLLQNIIEFIISSTAYGLLGSIVSFGKKTCYGIIGYGFYSSLDTDHVAYGYSTVIYGSAIVTTGFSSRLHFVAYVTISFLFSGITQPILMHWIYSSNGWMKEANIFGHHVVLHDFGSGFSLNLNSGLICFIGLFVLGRRLLKLHEIDEYSLGSESPIILTLGYTLVLVGYVSNFGFRNPVSTKRNHLILNVILATAGGGMASIVIEVFVRRQRFNFWSVTRLLQGSLIGVTFTTSVIDISSPLVIFAVSFIGGLIISSLSKILFKLALLDYCNILTIFFLPGVWCPIIQALATLANYPQKSSIEHFLNFLWHFMCSLTIFAFIGSIYGLLFAVLWCCGYLRNDSEKICYARSMKMFQYTTQCPLHHLIETTKEDDVLEPGVSGKTPNEAIHKKQAEINLKSFRVKYPDGKKSGNSMSLEDKSASVRRSVETARRLKNIFTLNNLKSHLSLGHPFSTGDKISISKIFKFQKNDETVETGVKPEKPKRSFNELMKSRKYVDFKRKKKIKTNSVPSNANQEIQNPPFVDNPDAIFDDGFVTLKLPKLKSLKTKL